MNALVATSKDPNLNKRSRENQDDDFRTYLPKLPDHLLIKGDKGDLVGPHSKFEKSESRFTQLKDENYTESDKEMLKNLDITKAVLNLRKFKKMVKTINLNNDKEGKDRSDTGTGKADDRVEVIIVSNDRNPSRHNSTRSSRSVVPDKRSTSKSFTGSDSRDKEDRNYRSSFSNDTLENDKNVKHREIPRKIYSKSLISHLIRSHVNIQCIHILVAVTTTKSL